MGKLGADRNAKKPSACQTGSRVEISRPTTRSNGWGEIAHNATTEQQHGFGSNLVIRYVTALSETDRDHQTSHAAQVFGDLSYKVEADGWMVEPHADLAWVSATTGAFTETAVRARCPARRNPAQRLTALLASARRWGVWIWAARR
jgi:hypothetical protein